MPSASPDRAVSASFAAQQLFERIRSGEVRALARAVSLVEDGAPEAVPLLAMCREVLQGCTPAFRVGVSGPAGAGKSTLVDGLMQGLRRQGRRVGILAVDPSSPFSGGAILGDRIRVGAPALDADVYMRSMATRGHLGGLTAATSDVLTVMEAAGFDCLLIETTGVGQGEIDVVRMAHVVVIVLVPGMGDSIQSLKAGVLEIASIFVLNKADSPGMDRLEAEIGEMVALSNVVSPGGFAPPVLKTVATKGEGIADLLAELNRLASRAGELARAPGLSGSAQEAPFDGAPEALAAATPQGIEGAMLDHLGVAVRSIEASLGVYEAIGVAFSGVEEVPHEGVRVAMLAAGGSRIELLEATHADSPVGRFLAERGEGLHHVALRVTDLRAAVQRLEERGTRLVSNAIRVGAGGHRYVFVHPKSANGVLLELVEAAAPPRVGDEK